MDDPKGQQVVLVVRKRRRTRRHRRNRSLRRTLWVVAFCGIIFGFWISSIPEDFGSYLASFLPSAKPHVSTAELNRQLALSAVPPPAPPSHSTSPVYPYSLVPGGVQDAKELRDVFDRDPVLASHYRDFDFRHARVIHLATEKTVYVSYRIAGKIYWTTRRVKLHAGELLITDGVLTVRGRCGNQVSENPRHEVSPRQEPNMATMERPMNFPEEPPAVLPIPNLFESSLQRPSFPGFIGPPPNYLVLSSPGFGFLFPPTIGTCEPQPPRHKGGSGGGGSTGGSGKKKKKGNPCESGGGGPGTAPEPATLVLLSTGLSGIYFEYRRRKAKAHSLADSAPLN